MEKWRQEFWRAKYPILPGADFTAVPTIELQHVHRIKSHNEEERRQVPKEEEKSSVESSSSKESSIVRVNKEEKENDTEAVLILCHSDSASIGEKLKTSIERCIDVVADVANAFEILIVTQADHQSASLEMVDQCHLVIPLLSAAFLECPFLMEQLNSAMYRHRFQQRIVFSSIIVGELPLFPVYPALGLCFFSLLDGVWAIKENDEDGLNKDQPVPSASTIEPSSSNDEQKHSKAIDRCLTTAGLVFANILAYSPIASSSFKTLLSVVEVAKWSKVDTGERESLQPLCFFGNAKITSFRSVIDNKSKQSPQPQQIAEAADKEKEMASEEKQNTFSTSSLLISGGYHQLDYRSPEEIRALLQSGTPAPEQTNDDSDTTTKENQQPKDNGSKPVFEHTSTDSSDRQGCKWK